MQLLRHAANQGCCKLSRLWCLRKIYPAPKVLKDVIELPFLFMFILLYIEQPSCSFETKVDVI